MLRLIGIVVSIGIADSLNPSTIGPALYLATGKHARVQVTEFTLGVFLVYLVGGAAIALGPGQLLLSLVPKPDTEDRAVLEIIAGVAMLGAAAVLWRHRDRLAERTPPDLPQQGRSSAILGATITAVELPTAFPYFAAIAAIVGSGLDPARQVILLVVFNVCFVLPLLGIVGTLWFGGDQATRRINAGREFLNRYWPVLLAGLALLAGAFVITLGVTGLAGRSHTRLGKLLRHLRKLIHP